MSDLWWLQPGWTATCCANCGAQIWPEGDPDWGRCFQCFTEELEQRRDEEAAYQEYMEREPRP